MTAFPPPARPFAVSPLAVAHHEAGHCIAALACGHSVESVALFAAGHDAQQRLGVCRSNRGDDAMGRFEAAVVSLAGPLAEQLFAGYADDVRAMMWRSSWAADRAKAENPLRACCRRLDDAALTSTRLVTQHWPRITRVAAALASEGELSGAGLDRLWRS
jgi:hypothetical protein